MRVWSRAGGHDDSLSNSTLVSQIAPKEDEVKALARYMQGVEARATLSPPEAFLATMSTVPRLMDKINLLILIQQFEVLPHASIAFPLFLTHAPSFGQTRCCMANMVARAVRFLSHAWDVEGLLWITRSPS